MYVNSYLKERKRKEKNYFSKSTLTFRCGMYFLDRLCFSRGNETAGLKEDSKQIVLNQTPLKRGRIQRPKPNLGRTAARQKELIDKKDPEEETPEGGEAEKSVRHHQDENNDPCLKSVSFFSSCLSTLFCWVLSKSLGNKDLIICRDRLCMLYLLFQNKLNCHKISSFLHLGSVFHSVRFNPSQQASTSLLLARCPTTSRTGRVKQGLRETPVCCMLGLIGKAEAPFMC